MESETMTINWSGIPFYAANCQAMYYDELEQNVIILIQKYKLYRLNPEDMARAVNMALEHEHTISFSESDYGYSALRQICRNWHKNNKDFLLMAELYENETL